MSAAPAKAAAAAPSSAMAPAPAPASVRSGGSVLQRLPTDVWVNVLDALPLRSWAAVRRCCRELWHGPALRTAEVTLDATGERGRVAPYGLSAGSAAEDVDNPFGRDDGDDDDDDAAAVAAEPHGDADASDAEGEGEGEGVVKGARGSGGGVGSGEEDPIADDRFLAFARHWPHAKALKLTGDAVTTDLLHALGRACPHVQRLTLSHCPALDADAQRTAGASLLSVAFPALQALIWLDDGERLTDASIRAAASCRALTELDVLPYSAAEFSDAALHALGVGCPQLRRVALTHTSALTDASFVSLCRRAGGWSEHLHTLFADDLHVSPDALCAGLNALTALRVLSVVSFPRIHSAELLNALRGGAAAVAAVAGAAAGAGAGAGAGAVAVNSSRTSGCGARLTELYVDRAVAGTTGDAVQALVSACPQLRVFKVLGGVMCVDLQLHSPTLTRLDLSAAGADGDDDLGESVLQRVVLRLPALRSLALGRTPQLHTLQWAVPSPQLTALALWSKALSRDALLSACQCGVNGGSSGGAAVSPLQRLDVAFVELPNASVRALLSGALLPRLRALSLSWNGALTDAFAWGKAAAADAKLPASASAAAAAGSAAGSHIATGSALIESLSVEGVPLSLASLCRVIAPLKGLQSLTVRNCPNIRPPAAPAAGAVAAGAKQSAAAKKNAAEAAAVQRLVCDANASVRRVRFTPARFAWNVVEWRAAGVIAAAAAANAADS